MEGACTTTASNNVLKAPRQPKSIPASMKGKKLRWCRTFCSTTARGGVTQVNTANATTRTAIVAALMRGERELVRAEDIPPFSHGGMDSMCNCPAASGDKV